MLCHDPRISSDREHRIETENPALMMAEFMRANHHHILDWEMIVKQADRCDEMVRRDEVLKEKVNYLLGENSKYT